MKTPTESTGTETLGEKLRRGISRLADQGDLPKAEAEEILATMDAQGISPQARKRLQMLFAKDAANQKETYERLSSGRMELFSERAKIQAYIDADPRVQAEVDAALEAQKKDVKDAADALIPLRDLLAKAAFDAQKSEDALKEKEARAYLQNEGPRYEQAA